MGGLQEGQPAAHAALRAPEDTRGGAAAVLPGPDAAAASRAACPCHGACCVTRAPSPRVPEPRPGARPRRLTARVPEVTCSSGQPDSPQGGAPRLQEPVGQTTVYQTAKRPREARRRPPGCGRHPGRGTQMELGRHVLCAGDCHARTPHPTAPGHSAPGSRTPRAPRPMPHTLHTACHMHTTHTPHTPHTLHTLHAHASRSTSSTTHSASHSTHTRTLHIIHRTHHTHRMLHTLHPSPLLHVLKIFH